MASIESSLVESCQWLFFLLIAAVKADDDDEVDVDGTVEGDLGKSRDGSRTDDEVVQRWVWLTSSTWPNLINNTATPEL